jgi:endogenous inhibitor of DNA gyrase (YacG/DUF329 family)
MHPKTDPDPIKLNCPTCKKLILWNDDFPYRPFCCDRCRLIDLGEWASENHQIAGNSLDVNSEEKNDEF